MVRSMMAACLLICTATAGTAASFTYRSSSVAELENFLWFRNYGRGGSIPGSDVPPRLTEASIRFTTGDRIRKNRTYIIDAARFSRFSRISITTGSDRQVVDWLIDVEIGSGIDYFDWRSSPSGEGSNGSYEYIDEECLEEIGEDTDPDICLSNPIFRASGIGTWDPIPAVPLPASLPFLAAGLAVLGLLRRRRLR